MRERGMQGRGATVEMDMLGHQCREPRSAARSRHRAPDCEQVLDAHLSSQVQQHSIVSVFAKLNSRIKKKKYMKYQIFQWAMRDIRETETCLVVRDKSWACGFHYNEVDHSGYELEWQRRSALRLQQSIEVMCGATACLTRPLCMDGSLKFLWYSHSARPNVN